MGLLCQTTPVCSGDKLTGLEAAKSRSKNTFQQRQHELRKSKGEDQMNYMFATKLILNDF